MDSSHGFDWILCHSRNQFMPNEAGESTKIYLPNTNKKLDMEVYSDETASCDIHFDSLDSEKKKLV